MALNHTVLLAVSSQGRIEVVSYCTAAQRPDGACSTGFVDRGVWLRIAKQFLSCSSVRGRGTVFHNYYKSIAKCAGKDFRDGAVPFD